MRQVKSFQLINIPHGVAIRDTRYVMFFLLQPQTIITEYYYIEQRRCSILAWSVVLNIWLLAPEPK